MSSIATTFIPVPLHERADANKEITDKDILNESDFPQEFTDWFNKHRADIEPIYQNNLLLMAHFSLKEFAFELQAEME